MQLANDSQTYSIFLEPLDLMIYPDSFITTMWRWKRQTADLPDSGYYYCHMRQLMQHHLELIEKIYKGDPAPNPFLYSSRHYYNFMLEDGATEINLLDYLMIPMDFDYVVSPPSSEADEDESLTTPPDEEDDFVANWPPVDSDSEGGTEDEEDSGDEGIWD